MKLKSTVIVKEVKSGILYLFDLDSMNNEGIKVEGPAIFFLNSIQNNEKFETLYSKLSKTYSDLSKDRVKKDFTSFCNELKKLDMTA